MTCLSYRSIADRHWLGEASPAEIASWQAHMSGCEACQTSYRENQALQQMFSAAAIPQAATDLDQRIMSAVAREPVPGRSRALWVEALVVAGFCGLGVFAGPAVESVLAEILIVTESPLWSWTSLSPPAGLQAGLVALTLLLNAFWMRERWRHV